MPRRCTVCTHSRRDAIERAILAGEPLRNISERVSVSATALHRHKSQHLPIELTKAKEAHEISAADDLLKQVQDLQTRALTILRKAEQSGDLRTALGAIREARGNLELLARLLGELKEGPTVNVLVSSQWVSLRTVILRALEGFPEARLKLSQTLSEVDNAGN